MLPNTSRIVLDFIAYLADPTTPLPSQDKEQCEAIRDLASQALVWKREEFEELKNYYVAADDLNYFLYRILLSSFEDEKTIARLITLFAYAGILSRIEGNDTESICKCVSGFIDNELKDWLEKSDSWKHICRLHQEKVKLDGRKWEDFCRREREIGYGERSYDCLTMTGAADTFAFMLDETLFDGHFLNPEARARYAPSYSRSNVWYGRLRSSS